MFRALTIVAVISTTSVALLPVSASAAGSDRPEAAFRPMVVAADSRFQASLIRISEGSQLFREALEGLRQTGKRIFVVTPRQFRSMDPTPRGAAEHSPDRLLAETSPIFDGDAQVRGAVVVVNLGMLDEIYAGTVSLPGELHSDLDRILIHEIYGHAMPYLAAGNLSGRCSDPQPGERASEACAIRRENAVRAELRLGRRVDAGLASLTLSRGLR